MKPISVVGTCAVLMTVCGAGVLSAQPPNRDGQKNQERRDHQKIEEAREDLRAAQRALEADQKELQTARRELTRKQAEEKAARKQIEDIRAQVQARLENQHDLDAALQAQQKAQAEFDAASAPVLAALRQTPAYQSAVQQAEEARRRLKLLKESAGSTSPERRQELAETTEQMLAVGQLEQAALQKDDAAKAARKQLDARQERVNDIRAKVRKSLEIDREVVGAVDRFQSAADERESATQRIAELQKKIMNGQGRLAREQARLDRAQQQDQRNDNRNKPDNSKNKN